MEIASVGVIGAGQMGNGIAQVCAVSGLAVTLVDVSEAALEKARATMAKNLDRQVAKGTIQAADKEAALGRITAGTDMAGLGGCDIVIEAATEREELKRKIFAGLCPGLKPEAILASNTSSISITRLASATDRPGRFIGMHFFNPVPMMALVEVIRGLQTSDATHAAVEALAKQLGKTPITVKNSPGFIVNRILCPMINEAFCVLGEGLASPEEIDEGMKLGCNHPIGPLALADMIGLDTMLAVMEVLYTEFGDPKYRPAMLMREMVAAGYLGRKTGRGVYDYRK